MELNDVVLRDSEMLHHLYKDRNLPVALNKQNSHRLLASLTTIFTSLSAVRMIIMSRYILFITSVLFLQGALGELICEELPVGMCSFSIASSGKRCLLETSGSGDGTLGFQCKTSEVIAMNMREYIENDECVHACGVDRNSVGISSDSLLESRFTLKLCSPECYYNCPNIVDLYNNLALAEGVVLPELCKLQRTSYRRSAMQLKSSSAAASGPVSAADSPLSATAFAPASVETLSSVDCAPAPL